MKQWDRSVVPRKEPIINIQKVYSKIATGILVFSVGDKIVWRQTNRANNVPPASDVNVAISSTILTQRTTNLYLNNPQVNNPNNSTVDNLWGPRILPSNL
jgi:hypothetical protein